MPDQSLRSDIESLLKNRQLVWAQETAAILEQEVSRTTQPLHEEIVTLKNQLQIIEGQREEWVLLGEQRVRSQLKTFLDSPSAPRQRHLHAEPVTIVAEAVEPIKVQRRRNTHKHLIRPILTVTTLALAGYSLAHYFPHAFSGFASHSSGQVAGVATEAPVQNKEYSQSYATLPLSATTWETLDDPDFHFHIEYPLNTSNLVRIVGGSNIWFLRNNGYLVKITHNDLDPGGTLDSWWASNSSRFTEDHTPIKSVFAGQASWVNTPNEVSQNSGTSHFIFNKGSILEIWIKDEPTSTDDGQRLARMVASFHLIP